MRKRPLTYLSVVIGMILLGPLVVIAGSLFLESDGVWSHLASTVLAGYVRNSVWLTLGVCFGALVIGTTVAWLVTLCDLPGRRILEWALLLPLAVPTYIIAYTYTDFLEFSGPVQSLLRDWTGWGYGDYWFPPIRSLGGAIVTFSLVLYPYVYLMARAAFLEQSVCVLEASRTLGQTPRSTFFRVGMPLARPALAAGGLLVAMETLADYGAVDYFAVDTFTTGIYRTRFSLGSAEGAAQLSALLLGLVATLIVIERLLRGGRRYFHSTNRYRELPRWRLAGWRRPVAVAVVWAPVVLGFGVSPIAITKFSGMIADMDGDGNGDVLTADVFDGIFLMLGNGDGTLLAPPVQFGPASAELAAGDLNGDGLMDLVSINHNVIGSGVLGNLTDTNQSDPLVAPFSRVLGPTRTLPVGRGGAAFDAAVPLAGFVTDQKGLPRIAWEAPDIGADENHDGDIIVTTAEDEFDNPLDPSSGTGLSLREAIERANTKC